MNIKIIEPIGQSEEAIRTRLRDLIERGGHRLFISDTRGMTDTELAIEQLELDELLSRSDIVSLHLPLTAETRGFIGREQLARMKRSAILINTARGPVVDQSALAEALDQNRLAGAGIDVFDMEPPLPSDHPILKAPNTVLAPHIGFETVEAMSAQADIALRHLEVFLTAAA
jgi:phosphoglycerate dehydrogenase-like enzyme